MCGICGIVDFEHPIERDEIERMTEILRHRGPDDAGIEMLPPAGLGFRRLSIIDLAGSHQPMSNEDDTLWLLFNGEIYNFRELRERLQERGHRLKTQGDGETILHLYEEHGLDFPHQLNGMFAIALWDARRRRLVLARDRLGIKPLYFAQSGRGLVFASETKSLLASPRVGRTLDRASLAAYMNYGSIPGDATCFREIQRVRPGHLVVFDASGATERRYWDVDFGRKRAWPAGELEAEVEATLRDAVRLQMRSDVPLGALLSGGVDSSLVAALMAELSPHPVEAFSIGYGAEGAYMNEIPWARKVAERFGMKHHALTVEPEDLVRDFERVTWHLDEPVGDPAAFLTLALSEWSRRHVTVVLSGLGADELFAGYRRYRALGLAERMRALPAWLRDGVLRPLVERLPEGRTRRFGDYARLAKKFLRSLDPDPRRAWASTVSYLPDYAGPLFEGELAGVRRDHYECAAFEEIWRRAAELPDPVDRAEYVDLHMYMVDQLLLLQDKMSMAASLEARVPYLDHRLVELAASIPSAAKLARGEPKAVLKKVAEKYVPRECIYREKRGFTAPVEAWLRGPLRERVHDLLAPTRVRDRGIFDVAFVEWMKREFYERSRDLSVQLYQALMLEIWLRLFVDGEARPGVAARRPEPARA